jgi:hypothetical protein
LFAGAFLDSINFGLPVLMQNCHSDTCAAVAISRVVSSAFTNMSEALSFAYMGVNWSIGLCLIFGLGFSRSYLWAGQRTAGSWEEAA